ncbi:MAG TPA: hypothetical protein VLV78_05160 [Thermoanaerobaculia bacterium]|nr:hypothetical protein [Thermoanaerobaculia bacterium]
MKNLTRLFWGVTGGVGTGLLLVAVPYALLATVAGASGGLREDESRTMLFVWMACALVAAYVVVALQFHRRLGRELRAEGRENSYVAKSWLLGLALPFLLYRAINDIWLRHDMKVNGAIATDAAQTTVRCVRLWVAQRPDAGFPRTLNECDCRYKSDDAVIVYRPAAVQADGHVHSFKIDAFRGRAYVTVDEQGLVTGHW